MQKFQFSGYFIYCIIAKKFWDVFLRSFRRYNLLFIILVVYFKKQKFLLWIKQKNSSSQNEIDEIFPIVLNERILQKNK